MTISSRGAVAALLLALVAASPSWAQAPDPVVASVNGQSIRLSEVARSQATLPQQYRGMPLPAIFPALLDQLIDAKLVAAEAKKGKVQDLPDYKARLADLEDRLARDVWLGRELERRVTADALKQRYEKKIKDLPAEEEVQARHILVADEALANSLLGDIKKGGDFAAIAKDKSVDKASGAQGGELGWFKKGDMVKEFGEAAFALTKGQLADKPVKTQFGYHLIKVEDRRKAAPPTIQELDEELRGELTREAFTAMMEAMRKPAKIERFNIDGTPIAAPPPAAVPPEPKK